jgi:VanZ family protein
MNSRRLALAAALLAAAAILSATLVPDRSITAEELAQVAPRRLGLLADFVRNVILFVPLGACLAWSGIRPRRALLAGALLSAGIELAQIAIPSRDPSVSDFAANTTGVALALSLLRTAPAWLRPAPELARALEACAGAAVVFVLVSTGFLLAPAPTAAIFYGHRTPSSLAHLAPYGGSVRDASIDGIEIPYGPIADSAGVRAALGGDYALRVNGLAGPPPQRLAAFVLITDADQNEILLLGPDRDDLVYRYRARGQRLGLEPARARLPHALTGIGPGAPLALAVSRSRADLCIAVNGNTECGYGPTVGDGWRLVVPDWRFLARARALLEASWFAALFAPLGFWARRNAATAAAWAASAAALVLLPGVLPLRPTPLTQLAEAGFGVGLGLAVRRPLASAAACAARER